jgi:hypothetical protein
MAGNCLFDCCCVAAQWYWVYVTSGAGFLVGCLRVLMKYPENLPGFFKEVTDCHVDPTWALPTVLLSAISLGGGANLGPEQAMVRRKGVACEWSAA